jgi:hypothetical protein
VQPDRQTTVQDRARETFDLFQTGIDLMRQNLRRRYPEAQPEEIERKLDAWMLERPGAEHGDGVGRPRLGPR